MKRGWTLIEMMIALSISAIMLGSIFGLLSSVWLLAKNASDEVQCVLHARAVREHLFYNLKDNCGLITAPTISVTVEELTATLHTDDDGKADLSFSSLDSGQEIVKNALNTSSSQKLAPSSAPYRYVNLLITNGKESSERGYVAYHDRLVIPLFGKEMSLDDIGDAF